MKYIKALTEKGISQKDLSKKIISEIEGIEYLIKKIESVNKAELDEDGLAELEDAKKTLNELDEQLAKSINRFNPDAFKKRLEVIEVMKQKRSEKAAEKRNNGGKVKEETKQTEPTQKEVEQTDDESEKINKKLEELKETVQVDEEKARATKRQEPEEVEYEDLQNVQTVKPKKMSTSLILMGVGAFFLTWGAVNFFKDRR